MPHGITQKQVDTAADAITATGERPTVERVRAHLGTGSPNTVTRMLDAWRQGLAERLREASLLPGLPDEVGQAMTALWKQAMQHARDHAQGELQREREALEQAKHALEAHSAEQASLLAAAQAETEKSGEAARRSTTQAETLQRLVERLEAEVKEQTLERTRLLTQNQSLETTRSRLRDEIGVTEEKAAKDRAVRDEHIKVVEDRAHAQIDAARMDLKATRVELAEVTKRHRKEVRTLRQQIESLTRALGTAEREAAHQRGVTEALKLKISSRIGTKPERRRGSSKSAPSPQRKRKRG